MTGYYFVSAGTGFLLSELHPFSESEAKSPLHDGGPEFESQRAHFCFFPFFPIIRAYRAFFPTAQFLLQGQIFLRVV